MEKKTNSLGTAGGVVGISAAATAPIFSWLFAPFYVLVSAVAIVLAAKGLQKSNTDGAPKGMAVTGLATGIATFAWSFIWSITLLGAAATLAV